MSRVVGALVAFFLCLLLLPPSSSAQAPLLVARPLVNITGTHSVTTGPVDVCDAIHVGSCPFSITLTESLSVTVQSTTSVGAVLPEGSPVVVRASLSPAVPTVTLSGAFTSGARSYSASFTVPRYPLTGKYTIPGLCIPASAILEALDIPAPPLAVPLKICLNPQFSTSIKGEFNGTGFSNDALVIWTSLDPQNANLQISNRSSSLTLVEDLSVEQTVSLTVAIEPLDTNNVIAALTIPLNIQDFSSPPSHLFTWYRVTIDKPDGGRVQPNPGTSWYSQNYQLVLQATPDWAHQFKDWEVNGRVVSNFTSFTYTVSAPAEIAAFFALSNAWLLIPLILLVPVILLIYHHMRRENMSQPRGQKLKRALEMQFEA